ncbi:hypothetical protein Scel_54990 [Streptomyces cellostaticus]|nr:hypothetical protein Scel_54990 [Streptomyces cellostaticus]
MLRLPALLLLPLAAPAADAPGAAGAGEVPRAGAGPAAGAVK